MSRVAPITVPQLGGAAYRGRSTTPQILGATEESQEVLGVDVSIGRFITASDDRNGRRIVVIGVEVRDELRMPKNPVGEYLLIGREWFRVVGLLEKRGEIFGFSQDNRVFIPFSVARSLTGRPVAVPSCPGRCPGPRPTRRRGGSPRCGRSSRPGPRRRSCR